MNAYRAYDAIEERKWAEQSLTEEKRSKSGLTIGRRKLSTRCRKSRQACSASLFRWTKAHTRASAAMQLARHITISFRQ